MASVPAVFADANVLFSAALRDILIELADADVIRLNWSEQVLDELDAAILSARPSTPLHRLKSRRDAMSAWLPAASVVPSKTRIIKAQLPDPKDVHVLATALEAGSSVILTFNLRDFPAPEIRRDSDGLSVTHPDSFLVTLLTTDAAPVLAAFEAVRARLTSPAMSVAEYLAALARAGLPQTADLLRYLLRS